MFANKLVAPIDRYNKHQKIAGRDIYDIHYFFSQGYKFKKEVIEERIFIENNLNEKVLTEDLSTLLPYKKFNKIRKVLKQETLMFLRSC